MKRHRPPILTPGILPLTARFRVVSFEIPKNLAASWSEIDDMIWLGSSLFLK